MLAVSRMPVPYPIVLTEIRNNRLSTNLETFEHSVPSILTIHESRCRPNIADQFAILRLFTLSTIIIYKRKHRLQLFLSLCSIFQFFFYLFKLFFGFLVKLVLCDLLYRHNLVFAWI